MTPQLLGCPFCGSSDDELMVFCDPEEGRDNSGPSRRIQCAVCHIEAPYYPSKAEAIAAWNRRTPSQSDHALAPKLAEIRGGLEGVTQGPWRAVTLGGSSTILTPTMPPKNDRRSKVTYGYKEGGGYCIAHPFLYQAECGKPDEATRMDFVCFGHKDAAHIARLDKDTVRAILDLVDSLQKQVTAWEEAAKATDIHDYLVDALSRMGTVGPKGIRQMVAYCVGLKAQLAEAERKGLEAAAVIAKTMASDRRMKEEARGGRPSTATALANQYWCEEIEAAIRKQKDER